jgi:hypothetical protein
MMIGVRQHLNIVMPGLDPGIHSVTLATASTATDWIAGSSPAMTTVEAFGAAATLPGRK